MGFKNLQDYKGRFPSSWEEFGPGNKIQYALFAEGDKLTKTKILELTEISNEEFTKGIEFLLNTKEVNFIEDSNQRKYYLEKESRKVLDDFYDFID